MAVRKNPATYVTIPPLYGWDGYAEWRIVGLGRRHSRHIFERRPCQDWQARAFPKMREGAVMAIVDDTSIPLQPRKLRRNDWTTIRIELRGYFSDLVKLSEAGAEAALDRAIERRQSLG